MKQILSGAAVALAFAVAVSAQTTPPTTSQPSSSQPAPAAAPKTQKKAPHQKMSPGASTVTLTGCLREGQTPDTFHLEHAQIAGSPEGTSGQPASQAGTSTTTGALSESEVSNIALASGDIDLKAHVGHQVEVRGTLTSGSPKMMTKDKGSPATSDTMGSGTTASSSSATGSSGTSATGTSGEKAAPGGKAHTLRVRSFRHISDTCPQ